MKFNIYKISPTLIQNILITLYNIKGNRTKFKGNYHAYLNDFKGKNNLSKEELKIIQAEKYDKFINYISQNSPFYKKILKDVAFPNKIQNLKNMPILSKADLAKNINSINTTNKRGFVTQTGGTTGKSLQVYFTKDNLKERFALLDYFRSWYGYKLGKKTAWFSGKDILTKKDIRQNKFWKTDYYHNVRYYSTFHIKNQYLKYFIDNLKEYKPEFISGFPTSIGEIAKYGLKNNIDFPPHIIKAVFTTSETVTPEIRENIERFFKTNLYNQYSSSEGAPFIFECEEHNLHLEMQSGIIEVLNDQDQDAEEGRLVVTSFTSYGTPLLRYDIGDKIRLSQRTCNCGNNNPLVEEILGRKDDFIYSPENGKMNLVNIANGIKDISGILKLQIIQNSLNEINFKLIVDRTIYTVKEEKKLIENFKDRLGMSMKIKISYVENISVEKSGKFRLVKNSIKHLVE